MAAVPAKEPSPRKNVASRARISAGKARSTWMQNRRSFFSAFGPGSGAAQAMAAGTASAAPRAVPVTDICTVAHSSGRTLPRKPQSGGNISAAMSVRWSRRLHISPRSQPVNQAAARKSRRKPAARTGRGMRRLIRPPPPRRRYPAGRPPSPRRERRRRRYGPRSGR